MPKTVVIGGGISGLAAAYALHKSEGPDADYLLLESSDHLGGKIVTYAGQGFLIEGGPDSFLTQKRAALDLCRELGLGDQLIGSNHTATPSTYVLSKGKLHPMPEGMMLMAPTMILPILRSKLISWPRQAAHGPRNLHRPQHHRRRREPRRLRPPPHGRRNPRQNRRPARWPASTPATPKPSACAAPSPCSPTWRRSTAAWSSA